MCVVIDETVIEGIWIPEKEYRIFEEMQLSSLSILLHCRQYVTPDSAPRCSSLRLLINDLGRCEQTMNVARDEYQENKVVICPLPTCTYRWCTACQQPVPLGGPDHACDTSTSTNLDNMVRENGWKFCPGKYPMLPTSGFIY